MKINSEASCIVHELQRLADSLDGEAEALPSGSSRSRGRRTDAKTCRIAATYIKELEEGLRDLMRKSGSARPALADVPALQNVPSVALHLRGKPGQAAAFDSP